MNSAPYASRPEDSRGRVHGEAESPTRSCFQRDRDRIIHSVAFRRLQYKTQVFVYHEGDHYRTRLTHSIEVAQIARSISRALGLNEDLAEALALAHDLGHTPFGHAGEAALHKVMEPYGGFDHNEQTFRILTLLENRYAAFDGLNLTWETLEGTVKHNGPLRGSLASEAARRDGVPPAIAAFDARHGLELDSFAGPEAQVAAMADDIAYSNHDIDDGLRAGLFSIADLDEVSLAAPLFRELSAQYPDIEQGRLSHEAVRRLIDLMVNDLLATSRDRLDRARLGSAAEVRQAGEPMIDFSEEMRASDRQLKAFLFQRMYRHERVNRMTSKVRPVVEALFEHYLADPDGLPDQWRAAAQGKGRHGTARLVADYIAGMTDRFALAEHDRVFGSGGRS